MRGDHRPQAGTGASPVTLRRVEPVRDELEFRDRVVAVAGLVAGAQVRSDLQTIDIDLELRMLVPERREDLGKTVFRPRHLKNNPLRRMRVSFEIRQVQFHSFVGGGRHLC